MKDQGNFDHFGMIEAMSPMAVLAPGVAVVAADKDVGVSEAVEQGGELDVQEFQASGLSAAAFGGVVLFEVRPGGVGLAGPGGTER